MDKVSVSFIIPARNEEKAIVKCLRAINDLNVTGITKEVILVDHGSSDRTSELAKSMGASVIAKKDGTIASLRNRGVMASRGEILVFLDADCIVSVDFLQSAFTILSKQRKSVIGFRMTIPDDSNWVAKCWDMLFSKRNITKETDWIPSGNMVMSRVAFSSVRGFDDQLETNEDYDFCFRLKQNGYRIISVSAPPVVHLRPPRTLRQVFSKELWHGKEVFRVFVKDVMQARSLNILRMKNSKVVLYALCHLWFILLLIGTALFAVSTQNIIPLAVAIALPIISSLIMALKYVRSDGNGRLVSGMTILLMTYGFSRAISLLPFDWRVKRFERTY